MVKLPPELLHPLAPVNAQLPETEALVSVVEVFGGVPVTVAVPVTIPVRVRVFPPEVPPEFTTNVRFPVTVSFVFVT
jgi:hypothetical protein